MTIDEYISFDNTVHTEIDSLDVGEIAESYNMEAADDDNDDGDNESESENQTAETDEMTTQQMLTCMQRMKVTATTKGFTMLLNKIAECEFLLEDEVSKKAVKQTTITDFFKKQC